MSNIKSYGVALPHFRIEDSILHPKGKSGIMKGVCFSDEDIITLAFEASSKFFEKSIDGIFFATSTPVFHNRYHASFLADLLNLPLGILSLDFVNSTRGGTDALLLANELVNSNKCKNILVIAVDVVFPGVGKEIDTPFGHAAIALLVSNEKGIAEIKLTKSIGSTFAEEFFYKGNKIQYDPRFSREVGFKTNINSVLKNHISDPQTFDSVILNSQYARIAVPFFLNSGFEEKQFAKDILASKIGHTGVSHALLLLANELENGKKNILLVDYTNGTNLIEIKNNLVGEEKILQEQLNHFSLIDSYQNYLLLRKAGNFDSLKYETKEMFSSEMIQEREKETLLYLKGMKCVNCETIYYLKIHRCKKCKSEKFMDVQLSKSGSVYAFTNEHYFPTSFPPVTMIVVDLDGGGRMTVQQTNTMYPEKNSCEIGSKVRLVLRKMIENDAKPNYFWKAIIV